MVASGLETFAIINNLEWDSAFALKDMVNHEDLMRQMRNLNIIYDESNIDAAARYRLLWKNGNEIG